MGATLTKRQANKYKDTNWRSSRLYESISSVLIQKIKFPNPLLFVGCFYLQCLQIGYRQIITTITTLHAITIIHRRCVERGTTLQFSKSAKGWCPVLNSIISLYNSTELLLIMFVSSSLILLSSIPSLVPEKSTNCTSYLITTICRNSLGNCTHCNLAIFSEIKFLKKRKSSNQILK